MTETISIILSFVHPLGTVLFATLWTLHILRNDYSDAVEQVESSSEQIQTDAAQTQVESSSEQIQTDAAQTQGE